MEKRIIITLHGTVDKEAKEEEVEEIVKKNVKELEEDMIYIKEVIVSKED